MFRDLQRDVVFPVIGSVVLFAALVVGGLIYIQVGTGSADKLITAMLIDAIMVIGLQIYIGNTGVLSFGPIGFGDHTPEERIVLDSLRSRALLVSLLLPLVHDRFA